VGIIQCLLHKPRLIRQRPASLLFHDKLLQAYLLLKGSRFSTKVGEKDRIKLRTHSTNTLIVGRLVFDLL